MTNLRLISHIMYAARWLVFLVVAVLISYSLRVAGTTTDLYWRSVLINLASGIVLVVVLAHGMFEEPSWREVAVLLAVAILALVIARFLVGLASEILINVGSGCLLAALIEFHLPAFLMMTSKDEPASLGFIETWRDPFAELDADDTSQGLWVADDEEYLDGLALLR